MEPQTLTQSPSVTLKANPPPQKAGSTPSPRPMQIPKASAVLLHPGHSVSLLTPALGCQCPGGGRWAEVKEDRMLQLDSWESSCLST